MSRTRRSPLPAPFDRVAFRRQVCIVAEVCDSTLCKWAGGDHAIGVHFCRSIVLALQGMGVIPPAGCKLPPVQPVVVVSPVAPLRVAS